MKKSILAMAAIAFVALTASSSYAQNVDKKSEKARENILEGKKDVIDAKKDLKAAQKDSVADYQQFKKESETKIKANEKSIAALKVKVSKANSKEKAAFEKKLGVLEQKNANLKKRLEDYNVKGHTKWATFKLKFDSDMDELGKEMKNFFISKK
jgi:murein L,D-transpeptidase YcbB/YkuD